ncbi:MAG: histidine kinase [Gammaproteobacteria bacterium]
MSASPPAPLPDSQRAYWICQLAGWGTYAALNVFAAILDGHLSWGASFAEVTILGAIGLSLTHLLHLFIHKYAWARMRLRARVPRVLAACIAFSVPAAVLNTLTGVASWQTDVASAPPSFPLQNVFLLRALNWLTLFLLWSLLYFEARSLRHRKWAELRESELARALQLSELRLLKSQLNPHFLFNALNTVRALIADEPARAQKAVTQLAHTLRYTLNSGHDELVSLDQELAIVDDYLALESLRCGERLSVQRNIAPATLTRRIPVMLLQTLVENAITHGIAELPSGGVLTVFTAFEGPLLVLQVENPCPVKPQRPAHQGIGLVNATERLRLLFGPQATLNLDLSRPGWATARVCMPVAP